MREQMEGVFWIIQWPMEVWGGGVQMALRQTLAESQKKKLQ